jgi:hypothetical protein
MHNFFTDRLGYKLIHRIKPMRSTIKLCFSLITLMFMLTISSNIALSETLECKITHRFISDRVELQKKWMPNRTVHTLDVTNRTRIIIPASMKMDGKLRRDKTTNRIKLSYKFKMSRPDSVKVDYVYQPSKGILKVYSLANTNLLKLHGQVASGKCNVIKIVKPKPVVKPKPPKITKPAYIAGTTLTSLHINFKNPESVNFMCSLEAIFYNVSTKQNITIPFFPDSNSPGHSILKTDVEASFDGSLPRLDNLTIKIQSSIDSSCAPKGLNYLPLVDNSFNKLIKINKNGNIEISNFEIKNLQ